MRLQQMVWSNQAAGRAWKDCCQPGDALYHLCEPLWACLLAQSCVLCGRNETFVVNVFSSGGFRGIEGHLQDVLTFHHPNDGQRTAIASDTTMAATDV